MIVGSRFDGRFWRSFSEAIACRKPRPSIGRNTSRRLAVPIQAYPPAKWKRCCTLILRRAIFSPAMRRRASSATVDQAMAGQSPALLIGPYKHAWSRVGEGGFGVSFIMAEQKEPVEKKCGAEDHQAGDGHSTR